MPRTVTVTFEDGTQHVYQGVPDDATPDSVTARATKDFNRPIVNIDGGRTPERSTLDKIIGPTVEGNWEKDSLIAPVIQGMAGRVLPALGLMDGAEAQQMVAQSDANLIQKGKNFVQGVKAVAEDPIAAAKRVYTAITERPAETAGQIVKGIAYDPELLLVGPGQMTRTAGALEAGGRVLEKAPAAAKTVAMAPVEAAQGFMGAVTGRTAAPGRTPGPLQTPSSRVPLGPTYIDPLDWAKYQAGEIPIQQVQPRPIQQLPESMMFGRPALALAGNEMPIAGQGAKAFGEAMGRQYRQQPILGAIDIGAGAMGIPPPVATYRAAQAAADAYLSGRGFDPNLPAQYAAAMRQADMGPPRPAGAPVAGPVAPPPIGTQNQMMLPLSNQIAQPPQQFNLSTTPGFVPPQPSAQNLQQAVQQAAASRVQGMPPVAGPAVPAMTEQQRAIIEQIRSRGRQQEQAPTLDLEQMAKYREADLAMQARKAAGEAYQPPKTTQELLQDLKLSAAARNEPPTTPVYTAKEQAMFEQQQKTARRGFGAGETISEIEVMAAENLARRTGLASDQRVADQLRQRYDQQIMQGKAPGSKAPPGTIGFITPQETTYHELAKGGGQKKLAGGVTQMSSEQTRPNGVVVKVKDAVVDADGLRTVRSTSEYNPKTGELLESIFLPGQTDPLRKYTTDANGIEFDWVKAMPNDQRLNSPTQTSYSIITPDNRSIDLVEGGKITGDMDLAKQLGIKTPDDMVKMIQTKQAQIEKNLQMIVPKTPQVAIRPRKEVQDDMIMAKLGDREFMGAYKQGDDTIVVERTRNRYFGRAPGDLGQRQFNETTTKYDSAGRTFQRRDNQWVEVFQEPTLKQKLQAKFNKPE